MLASDYGDGEPLQSRGLVARACVVEEGVDMVSKPIAYSTVYGGANERLCTVHWSSKYLLLLLKTFWTTLVV